MAKRKDLIFYGCALGWAVFVAALTVYLFFPYQKALKLAMQNVLGTGRVAVSMEGVTTKLMGVGASRILLKPDASGGQAALFELSNIDIFWNPISLLTGKLTIHSKASLYGGVLRCVLRGSPLMGGSSPDISLTFDHVNLARFPEGVLPWLKGMTGTLDGFITKETPPGRPDKQTGAFHLNLRGGQVKDLQVTNMPRLIIPYQEIAIEGKIDGPRINVVKLALKSDLVSLTGSGLVESGDTDQTIDMKLSYETLSQIFPVKGKGLITISGSRKAPVVVIAPQEAPKPAEGPQQAAAAGTAHGGQQPVAAGTAVKVQQAPAPGPGPGAQQPAAAGPPGARGRPDAR